MSHYHEDNVIPFVPRQTSEPEVKLTISRRNGVLVFDYGDMSTQDKVNILFQTFDAIRLIERDKVGREFIASSALMRDKLKGVPAFFGKRNKRRKALRIVEPI